MFDESVLQGTCDVEFVVPVYNEAHVLAASITRLCRYLDETLPFTWRVTIADNASTDDTLSVAHSLAREFGHVSVLHLDMKGRGRALREAWLASDATVVAYMDVDLSTGLNAVLPLVAPLLSGHSDVSIGSRLLPTSAVARGPQREFISRTYNFLLRLVFLNRFRDAQCGFKALRSDIAQALLPAVEDNAWFFDTELLLLAEHNGLRIAEIAVDWIDDPDSRVHISSTVAQDLHGMRRMFLRFLRGKGTVDLGPHARATLADDFGRQFVGFALVGSASTAASLGLYLALRHALSPLTANLVALTATTLANIWANRRFTFGQRGRSDRSRQYLSALAVWLVGATTSSAALALTTKRYHSLLLEAFILLATWGATAVIRFSLLRSWVFRTRPAPRHVQRTRFRSHPR